VEFDLVSGKMGVDLLCEVTAYFYVASADYALKFSELKKV